MGIECCHVDGNGDDAKACQSCSKMNKVTTLHETTKMSHVLHPVLCDTLPLLRLYRLESPTNA